MKKIKLIFGISALTVSVFIGFSSNLETVEAHVWDKKPIDCTWHFGTQCTGSGNGCDYVDCEQYKDPKPGIEEDIQ